MFVIAISGLDLNFLHKRKGITKRTRFYKLTISQRLEYILEEDILAHHLEKHTSFFVFGFVKFVRLFLVTLL